MRKKLLIIVSSAAIFASAGLLGFLISKPPKVADVAMAFSMAETTGATPKPEAALAVPISAPVQAAVSGSPTPPPEDAETEEPDDMPAYALPTTPADGKDMATADGKDAPEPVKELLDPIKEFIDPRTNAVDPHPGDPPAEYLNTTALRVRLLSAPNPQNTNGPVVSAETK